MYSPYLCPYPIHWAPEARGGGFNEYIRTSSLIEESCRVTISSPSSPMCGRVGSGGGWRLEIAGVWAVGYSLFIISSRFPQVAWRRFTVVDWVLLSTLLYCQFHLVINLIVNSILLPTPFYHQTHFIVNCVIFYRLLRTIKSPTSTTYLANYLSICITDIFVDTLSQISFLMFWSMGSKLDRGLGCLIHSNILSWDPR